MTMMFYTGMAIYKAAANYVWLEGRVIMQWRALMNRA